MTTIQKFKFSKLDLNCGELSGQVAQVFRFDNGVMSVDITNLGGAIVAIEMPDNKGKMVDICLGFSNANDYVNQSAYFGVIAGRYANRIAKGEFELNGTKYSLDKNDGENHLHGGNIGFSKRLWDYEIIQSEDTPKLKLTLVSEDMDAGYPGKVIAQVTYSLDDDNRLAIEYNATSDKDTVINLTNHSYFNLNGHNKGDILRHKLYINGDKFVRVNKECIPTGEIVDVQGTPFDFTASEDMHTIGERIGVDNEDLINGGGYDHSYVINTEGTNLVKAATLQEDYTGRQLNVYTNKPAMQLYTGNALDKKEKGKYNCKYGKRTGVCLETQFYPDSPNQKIFPSCVLKAGENYNYTTVFEFKVIEKKELTDNE